MFYYLDLFCNFPGISLFKYVTFRAAGAGLTAFVLAVLMGPRVIAWLRRRRVIDSVAKNDSKELDELHRRKKDTPTMGGLLIVAAALLGCLLWANWPGVFAAPPEWLPGADPARFARAYASFEAAKTGGFYVLTGCGVLAGLAILGFIDDFLKLKGRKGMKLWTKLFWQVLVALGAALALYCLLPQVIEDPHRGRIYLPFFSFDAEAELASPGANFYLFIGAGFLAFAVLVIAGSSNGVNLADGLDGLAVGCAAIVAGTYAALSYVAGHFELCGYLLLPFVQGSGELAVASAALAGGCLGFLWYNCHPADVFMGDTASLAVGGFIGYVALVVKHELLLVLVGGIFVAEAVSVLLQVISFRLFGRRVFKIAPLHHHFEFEGWPENKVVVRFWIVAIVLALASIATLKIR